MIITTILMAAASPRHGISTVEPMTRVTITRTVLVAVVKLSTTPVQGVVIVLRSRTSVVGSMLIVLLKGGSGSLLGLLNDKSGALGL